MINTIYNAQLRPALRVLIPCAAAGVLASALLLLLARTPGDSVDFAGGSDATCHANDADDADDADDAGDADDADDGSGGSGARFNATTATATQPCALLFFGLPRDFRGAVLPSLRRNVLEPNPRCAVFVHVFNRSTVTTPRNGEFGAPVHAGGVWALRDAAPVTSIEIEHVDRFAAQYDLGFFRAFFPPPRYEWSWPASLDNMIMQWHSIRRAWALMAAHEARRGVQFKRVGLFRIDTRFETAIDIACGDAVTALLGNHAAWMSDRLFYGARQHAAVWATRRFEHVARYVNTSFGRCHGLHSERFLFHLMATHRVPMRYHDLCVQRVRATGRIERRDCEHGLAAGWRHDYAQAEHPALADRFACMFLPRH